MHARLLIPRRPVEEPPRDPTLLLRGHARRASRARLTLLVFLRAATRGGSERDRRAAALAAAHRPRELPQLLRVHPAEVADPHLRAAAGGAVAERRVAQRGGGAYPLGGVPSQQPPRQVEQLLVERRRLRRLAAAGLEELRQRVALAHGGDELGATARVGEAAQLQRRGGGGHAAALRGADAVFRQPVGDAQPALHLRRLAAMAQLERGGSPAREGEHMRRGKQQLEDDDARRPQVVRARVVGVEGEVSNRRLGRLVVRRLLGGGRAVARVQPHPRLQCLRVECGAEVGEP
mmetsp:Transcript_3220/g.7968  ORF Transcript_3220/g.7968 Transcript_3220/m.7968 type:complete len:291 (+) Transcript_3220:361-1233(+)